MSNDEERGAARCDRSVDPAVLADYWMGALGEVEASRVEEHLLACGACSARLRETVALVDAVRDLARAGDVRMVVSDAFVRRAAREGLHVREYAIAPGGSVQCTVAAEDDLVVARLAADLAGLRRVDLCLHDAGGVERFRLRDIPFDPAVGNVIYQESITFLKSAPTTTLTARLVAPDEGGGERLLGEYTFNHTRALPGPAGW